MSHDEWKELLSLSLYDEVNEEERILLEDHLKTCQNCKKEQENLKKLHLVLGSHPAPGEDLLQDARTQLRSALRAERNRESIWQKIRNVLPGTSKYGVAWASGLALVLGLVIGRFAFVTAPPQQKSTDSSNQSIEQVAFKGAKGAFDQGTGQITNVKFTDSDPSDGDVEFTFNAVAPMHYKGPLNDPKVQDVLSHAIVNEDNPGTRLDAVNALEKYAPKDPDPDIKAALIKAAEKDSNPAVRQQALSVLEKFRFDQEIKDTFIYVLTQDNNPGLRIEAIKGLEGNRMDQQVLDVLKKSATTDNNNYIRLRANNVLREVKQ